MADSKADSLGRPIRIAVACGGTGGHTFPGLATARTLALRGHEVEVLVSGRSIESSTLKGWDGKCFKTGARKGSNPFLAIIPTIRTILHFLKNRPDALLAMGSYASLPPVLAARVLFIPVILHEANAIPGKSNRFLSIFARAVATSFPGNEAEYHCRRVVLTGLPVRAELLEQPPFKPFNSDGGFTVFVTGGSQGAVPVNDLASSALAIVASSGKVDGLRVIHQTGNNNGTMEKVKSIYNNANLEHYVSEFMDMPTMGGSFKVAQLVIARAGAATCAEIAIFGLPAILIPLPSAVRDHQYLNAKNFSEARAVILKRQEDWTPESLAEEIISLANDLDRLARFSKASHSLAKANASENLANLVESFCR